MSTKDSIFIVTKGAYSDYHIVACFTNHELAATYMDVVNRNEYEQLLGYRKSDLAVSNYSYWLNGKDGETQSYENWLEERSRGDFAWVEEHVLWSVVPALNSWEEPNAEETTGE